LTSFSKVKWAFQKARCLPLQVFHFSKCLLIADAQLWHIRCPPFTLPQNSEDNAIVIIKANSLIKSDIGSVATIPLVSSSASTLDRVKIMVPAKVMVACD
jgi:hypothetical protein